MDTNHRSMKVRPTVAAAPLPPTAAHTRDELELLLWRSRRRALLGRAARGDADRHTAGELALADGAIAALVRIRRWSAR